MIVKRKIGHKLNLNKCKLMYFENNGIKLNSTIEDEVLDCLSDYK